MLLFIWHMIKINHPQHNGKINGHLLKLVYAREACSCYAVQCFDMVSLTAGPEDRTSDFIFQDLGGYRKSNFPVSTKVIFIEPNR